MKFIAFIVLVALGAIGYSYVTLSLKVARIAGRIAAASI